MSLVYWGGECTYGGVDRKPGVCIGVKEEDLIVAVFALETAIENNFLSGMH